MTASTTEIQDCLKTGDLNEADRLVMEALQQDPSDAQLLLLKGDIAARLGRLDAALTAYKDALPHHPKKDRVRLRILSTLFRLEAWNDVEAAMANLESDISRFRAALMTCNPAQALVLARRLRDTKARPVAEWCGPYLDLLFELNLLGEAKAVVKSLVNEPTMSPQVRRYTFWIAFETRGPISALEEAAAAQNPDTDPELEWCQQVVALLWTGKGPWATRRSSPIFDISKTVLGFFGTRLTQTVLSVLPVQTRRQSFCREGVALRDRSPFSVRAPLSGVVAKLQTALDAALLLRGSRKLSKAIALDRRGRALPWLIARAPTSIIRSVVVG